MMNTKTLMTMSAIFLGIGGVLLSFLPQEALHLIGKEDDLSFILQICGALFLGFAMLNWMVKSSLIGGIYNKGIVVANFAHFFIGSSVLVKQYAKNTDMSYLLILGIIYSIFAIGFGYLLFNGPKLSNNSASHS
ncbi:hypothetical protein [Lutimonas sp.]|jgi:hypothetical protein|uniref:hypothetical protein n=1 Tax=Lutimonas sp. TaxID=1872403 RepID=UPI003C735354